MTPVFKGEHYNPASFIPISLAASFKLLEHILVGSRLLTWSQIAPCPLKSTAFGGTGPVRPMLEAASEVSTEAAT